MAAGVCFTQLSILILNAAHIQIAHAIACVLLVMRATWQKEPGLQPVLESMVGVVKTRMEDRGTCGLVDKVGVQDLLYKRRT